jgi:hypothetical protein
MNRSGGRKDGFQTGVKPSLGNSTWPTFYESWYSNGLEKRHFTNCLISVVAGVYEHQQVEGRN